MKIMGFADILKITWNNDEIALRLKGLRVSLADQAAAHSIMNEMLLRNTQRRFRRKVSPSGKPWPALSPLTLATRRSKRGILRDTGELFGSIHMQADERAPEVGTPLKHPRVLVHQHGTTIRPKHAQALRIPGAGSVIRGRNDPDLYVKRVVIPAHPYLGIGAEDAADALKALEGWLKARLK